jgi:hypothetical protein
MGHPQVGAGQPVGQHHVPGGKQVAGGERQLINVAHQRPGGIAADLPSRIPPQDPRYPGEVPPPAAFEDLQDGLLGLPVSGQVRAEIGQARLGVEVAVHPAHHDQSVPGEHGPAAGTL